MNRWVALFLALLFLGCASPPNFTLDYCVTSCESCEVPLCSEICTSLSVGLESEACHDISQAVWDCAVTVQCAFPEDCSDQIGEFLVCEP